MDETIQSSPNENPGSEEHDKRLMELENARKWLFDDEWVRAQAQEGLGHDESGVSRSAVDPGTGLFDQFTRARNAFNNIMTVVPGTGGHWPDEELVDGSRTAGEFRHDFREIAAEIGIDIAEVEKLNDDEELKRYHTRDDDPEFKLNRFIFPIMEKMVKERNWKVFY